jgi:nickel/cobalt transporter (NiCoT) family protein
MEIDLPRDWSALCLLVFVLGMRHGFDADHLATIDGLTRFNARARPVLARYCGAWFSAGHGLVVVAIALTVSLVAARWQVPAWLEVSGTFVTVLFLTMLGLANLHAVISTPSDKVVQPVGIRGRMFAGLATGRNPAALMAIGALFALSFDTVSQAMLFALTAAQFDGWRSALSLGLLFMLGMFVTDGLNGLWISHLVRRADATARIASRVLGLVVSLLSLAVAGFSVARSTLPGLAAWSEGRDLAFGAAVVSAIAVSFIFAMWLARRRPVRVR